MILKQKKIYHFNMRHGSLFSGIGGFDLASEWMGWENVFHCEWNPFGQKLLNYYWPNAITYNDITKTDFTIHRGTIDILTGGFPCQPYSSAGKRLGKEDERHLWPEMLRAIREIQPTWVVGENVRGLTNWNNGLVFDEVQAELEAQGYEVTPFLLPACAVNAPHRRDRIWFVAFNSKSKRDTKVRGIWERKDNESIGVCKENIVAFKDTNRNGWSSNIGQSQSCERKQWDTCTGNNERISTNNEEAFNAANSDSSSKESPGKSRSFNCDRSDNNAKQEQRRESTKQYIGCNNVSADVKHSDSFGQEWRSNKTDGKIAIRNFFGKSNARINKWNAWQNFPTVSPICDGNDGLSNRLDGITFSKWRNESIKAGGNAIVPQVVYQIFKSIEQYNQLNNQLTL
jgi:DNA (cytosine-5)-methyltransferase 1